MSDSYHIMVKRDRTVGCKTFLILMRPIGHIFKMLKIDLWSGVGFEPLGYTWRFILIKILFIVLKLCKTL